MTTRLVSRFTLNRVTILMGLVLLLTAVILARLFYLQIIKYGYYYAIAQQEHQGYTELPARRGEILIKDYHSGEVFKLATNTTFNLLYADPTLITNPKLVAETFAPFIFDLEESRAADYERVQKALVEAENRGEVEESNTEEPSETKEEKGEEIRAKTDQELSEDFRENLEDTLSQRVRKKILLEEFLEEAQIKEIEALGLIGIEVEEQGDLYAYPPQIENPGKTAEELADFTDFSVRDLKKILEGKNRYVVLKRKLDPEVSDQIKEILGSDPEDNFIGVRLSEEYYRFYPEKTLAAQILGFVDANKTGQYGIEGKFNTNLRGKAGFFTSQIDASGKQITVGESTIQPARDGDNVTLTIDRSVQLEMEKILEQGVKDYQADSGQIVIMDPKTGEIIALAHYPTFDPNEYAEVFAKKEIELTSEQIDNLYQAGTPPNERLYLYIRTNPDERIEIFYDEETDTYYRYENRVGPEVYKNKVVLDIYEPGSAFKIITMAAALDSGEVTPNTKHYCAGPIKVDEYEIHTYNDEYHGWSTMTEVLEQSCNIGISFVAQKLGDNLFYNYMLKFGFGQRTDVEFESEESGQIEYFENWSDSELVTHGFGQGIAVTPIQMVTALSAIANGGTLMQPFIADSIESEDGKITEFEPRAITQVITKETADTLTAMMVNAVENGVASTAQVKDHYLAGKSGTSQTYKWSKVLKGPGTTITSFVGFGPIDDPKFAISVKLDHPKTSEWCATTAAPLASKIAEYLFNYYNIPPDK